MDLMSMIISSKMMKGSGSGISSITTGIGLKAEKEGANIEIDFDDDIIFVIDCGTANFTLALLDKTTLE